MHICQELLNPETMSSAAVANADNKRLEQNWQRANVCAQHIPLPISSRVANGFLTQRWFASCGLLSLVS